MRYFTWILFFMLFFALGFSLGFFAYPMVDLGIEAKDLLARDDTKRVILITLDTCRYDRLEIMPNVREWAEDAVNYEYALATSPWTTPSIASMMTGKYPSEMQMERKPKGAWIKQHYITIAEKLRDRGFETVAWVSHLATSYERGFSQGFNEFYFRHEQRSTEIFANAMDWLDAHPEDDCFLWLHCWDTHWPYLPPAPDQRLQVDLDGRWDYGFIPLADHIRSGEIVLLDCEKIRAEQLYDEEARYFDKRFGRFIKWQEENYPAMVIFTSDHGEEFWEHGAYEHGHSLYDELIHVPLIVKYPDNKLERKHNEPFPTKYVSSLIAAWEWDESEIDVGDEPVFHEHVLFGPSLFAVTHGGFRYILNDETGWAELYDIGYDPKMKRDLAVEMPKKYREMGLLLKDFRLGKPVYTPTEEELKEELRSIGYLGG